VLRELTSGIGADRVIDPVGVDATSPHQGPAAKDAKKLEKVFKEELKEIAGQQNPSEQNWQPGHAPSQALVGSVEAVAKAGTLSIIGVNAENSKRFPIGNVLGKNLTLKMGNCKHRRYIPSLVNLVRSGALDPAEVLTQVEPIVSAIHAYKAFDTRQPGWIKVKLEPSADQSLAA
jgi:threonine dehydrogenase-like Zn-dependent dehydrogenase